jgi:hypothetical protein
MYSYPSIDILTLAKFAVFLLAAISSLLIDPIRRRLFGSSFSVRLKFLELEHR